MTSERDQAECADEDDDGAPDLRFPYPPPDFNPLDATVNELTGYGLPPRPDPGTTPELSKAWLDLFKAPLTFVQPTVERVEALPQPLQPVVQVLPFASRYQDSPNWCGATIVPHNGNQFVSLYGRWCVPEPSLPPPEEWGPLGPEGEYHCSTWIGLDGNRLYLDSSLPQVGTEQILKVGPTGTPQVRKYTAWFQWWARTQVSIHRKVFNKITVHANLQVMAALWVISETHIGALFRTYGQYNQAVLLIRKSPLVYLRGDSGPMGRPLISGATAEWILERPETLKLHNATLDRFPKYTPVTFDHCVAGCARGPQPATSEEILTGPRFFRMDEVPPALPPLTRLISMPKLVSTTSVRVHYGGFLE
jgi:hypothetical protein